MMIHQNRDRPSIKGRPLVVVAADLAHVGERHIEGTAGIGMDRLIWLRRVTSWCANRIALDEYSFRSHGFPAICGLCR